MKEPPVLFVDVMDTLVYDPFNEEIPAFFGLSMKELIEQNHRTAWVQFELGEISEAEYLRRYFTDGRTFDHADFLNVVRDAYRWVDCSEQLLQQLQQQGCRIHALSNYPVWYRMIEEKLKLSRYLQWTFVSCRTGVRKPDPRAYLGAARELRRRPETCLFIDDRVTNCRAAEKQNMMAIHFVDAASLSEELARRQLIE